MKSFWPALRFFVACLCVGTLCGVSATADSLQLPIAGLFRTTYQGSRTVQVPRFDPALGTLESVTIEYSPQISGTVSGTSAGPPNAPNGLAIEFSGSLRLAGPGFGSVDYPFYYTRSDLVYQPDIPVFQTFGPADLTTSPVSFTSALDSYIGTGFTSATLSWPQFTAYIFWSNGGTQGPITRELGAVGGTVTYHYVPEPTSAAIILMLAAGPAVFRRKL